MEYDEVIKWLEYDIDMNKKILKNLATEKARNNTKKLIAALEKAKEIVKQMEG
ncbi:hypothetical protein [Caloranaerobacter sp. DY30410]|uniref:hypothetical protein n=1 Tax=Caloranaerobacter sp. DY30410 TaxID=3238305 RepID=UPI003D01F5E6